MTQSRENLAVAPRPALYMRKEDKKKHILATMESLVESGVGGMSMTHIADRSGYRISPAFRDLLWDMVDDELIFADMKSYNGGVCDVRWIFYTPDVWRTKKMIKQQRERDRRR
jgi:hypothetical protein